MIGFTPTTTDPEPADAALARAWRQGQWNALVALSLAMSGLIEVSGDTVKPLHLWMTLALAVDDRVLDDLDDQRLKVRAELLAVLRKEIHRLEATEQGPPLSDRPIGGYL